MNRQPLCRFSLAGITGICILFCGCSSDSDRFSPEIRSSDIENHITRLADATMAGRLAGSPDEATASNYIADHFRDFGLEPGGEDDTWLQLFVLEGPLAEAMNMDGFMSRNVLGIITGTTMPNEFIVIGAHYDGQGYGGVVSMMETNQNILHQSADDNASGTSGVLELAHYFVENPPGRSILFAAFSGEEMGLLGSRHFVDNQTLPYGEIRAMINLDMIGRMENHEVSVNGAGSPDYWEALINHVNEDSLRVTVNLPASGSSDHVPFNDAGIPAIHIFTGSHDDYHRPGDTPEKINFNGTEQIIRLAAEMIGRLDTLSVERF